MKIKKFIKILLSRLQGKYLTPRDFLIKRLTPIAKHIYKGKVLPYLVPMYDAQNNRLEYIVRIINNQGNQLMQFEIGIEETVDWMMNEKCLIKTN